MIADSLPPDKDLAKQELLQAIAYFIERQSLVAQVITDLGLSVPAIGIFGPGAWSWSAAQDIVELQRTLETTTRPELANFYRATIRAHELRIPQEGLWHDQQGQLWRYYFHGTGCQITNVRTQEIVDWDCPNVAAFDPFFFEAHLAWQIANGYSPYQLRHLHMWIAQNGLSTISHLIDQLIHTGHISSDMTLT